MLFWVVSMPAAALLGIIAFKVWRFWWRILNQMRLDRAAVDVAEAEADKKQAEAAAAWRQVHLIPSSYIGAMVERPSDAGLYVWAPRHSSTKIIESPPIELPQPGVPGPIDLFQVLTTFTPSPQRILLAMTATGLLTCSLEGLSHVAL